MQAPLEHIRVIDLCDLRGAMAGRLLADLGADVLKIEPPGGDPGRWHPPFAGNTPGPDRSLSFLYRNANKRGAVIDLGSNDGQRRLSELIEHADVLIDNLGPDPERPAVLSLAEVRARHPHLIHAAIADFGFSGPRAGWRAEPLPAFAASGALYASGFRDRPPCWLPGFLAHDCASVFAVAGTLAAVYSRAAHGQGQTIEISVQEAALRGLNPWSIPLADYARMYPMIPVSPPRNADGIYLVLEAADGYVRVLPGTVRQWRAFVRLLGDIEALAAPEWEIPTYRMLNGDVIRLFSADALRHRTRADIFAEAQRLGVPLAPVQRPEEFVACEQTRARGYFRRTGFPWLGEAPFAPGPVSFSRTPAVLRRPAPAAGAGDTAEFPPRADTHEPAPAPYRPLAGMRVIDLGVGAVGPEVGWLFAELGAEVIKIESRENLDFLRGVTIEPDTPNRAWTFNTECRGQKSVCLNLRDPRGRELALRLCARADVVVENNRGGVVAQWGLDYEDVRAVRHDVVYLASQGFGRGGPLGEAPSFGPLNSSFAGANWLWNHPDSPYPAGVSLNHPDHIASQIGAVAVLAALEHRRRTGEGQFIEMAQTEAAAYLMGERYLEEPCTGKPVVQRGNAAEYAVPHGVYTCAGEDRWVAIAVVGDDAWERFRRCLGWTAEAALAAMEGRLAARAEIDARVVEWTSKRSPEEAAAALQAAGVSAMAVMGPADHRADAHLAERGAIVTVEHPEIGSERHAGNPIRMSRDPLTPAGAAPLLGADTAEVLTRLGGIDAAEVERLAAAGVCR